MKEIKYVEHPCSIEQKRELTSQGYKVVDARFAMTTEKGKMKPKTVTPKTTPKAKK